MVDTPLVQQPMGDPNAVGEACWLTNEMRSCRETNFPLGLPFNLLQECYSHPLSQIAQSSGHMTSCWATLVLEKFSGKCD